MSEVLNAFTVDLEDWYQGLEIGPETCDGFDVAGGTDLIPNMKHRLFEPGHLVALKRIQEMGGITVADGYLRIGAVETLSGIVSGPIRAHRAPFFSITKQSEWAFDVLAECGIECDSSVFPVKNYRYGIADAPRWRYQVRPGLTEFPLSTYCLRGRNIPVGGVPISVYFLIL